MNFDKNKIFILVIIAILVGSVFIYKSYSIGLQKDKEESIILLREDIRREKQEQYDDCILKASFNKHDNWHRACLSLNLYTQKCMELQTISCNDFGGDCKKMVESINKECFCKLPSNIAQEINKNLQEEKDQCNKIFLD